MKLEDIIFQIRLEQILQILILQKMILPPKKIGSKMDIPEGYTLEQIETMDQSTRFKNDEVTNITAAYQIQEGENLENRVSLSLLMASLCKN